VGKNNPAEREVEIFFCELEFFCSVYSKCVYRATATSRFIRRQTNLGNADIINCMATINSRDLPFQNIGQLFFSYFIPVS
jgi:hypothetical protein